MSYVPMQILKMLFIGRNSLVVLLNRACWSNNIEIVDSLLQNKCPIDKQNVAGITPCIDFCLYMMDSDDWLYYGL